MIKYKVTTWATKILSIEVLRETDKQVVFYNDFWRREQRENKASDGTAWFDTWDEAHQFLVAEAQKNVEALRLQLEQAKGRLGQVKGMRQEESA